MTGRIITPSEEYLDKERQSKSIRKDIRTAYKAIYDAKLRYIKSALHARSKKQAEDMSVFNDLSDYSSKRDIQDAYGYDVISEAEMDRLNNLWDMREQHMDESGRFSDRVIEMLDHAMNCCGDKYQESLAEFDIMERQLKSDLDRIERENRDNTYKRHHR